MYYELVHDEDNRKTHKKSNPKNLTIQPSLSHKSTATVQRDPAVRHNVLSGGVTSVLLLPHETPSNPFPNPHHVAQWGSALNWAKENDGQTSFRVQAPFLSSGAPETIEKSRE